LFEKSILKNELIEMRQPLKQKGKTKMIIKRRTVQLTFSAKYDIIIIVSFKEKKEKE